MEYFSLYNLCLIYSIISLFAFPFVKHYLRLYLGYRVHKQFLYQLKQREHPASDQKLTLQATFVTGHWCALKAIQFRF